MRKKMRNKTNWYSVMKWTTVEEIFEISALQKFSHLFQFNFLYILCRSSRQGKSQSIKIKAAFSKDDGEIITVWFSGNLFCA